MHGTTLANLRSGLTPSHVYGRYALYEALGRGGAASVYLGVARGDDLTPLAVKVLHESASREAGAVTRLLDEVRLSRSIVHPNVVRVVDFVSDGEEMLAVMEYVHGEPLSRLLADARRAGARVPLPIVAAIASDILRGLHAAHEARSSDGTSLELVHRDVTPENMLVGADGSARLTDFGVAKAQGRLQMTRDGGVRGKIAYLAPEQIGGDVSRRTDIYAAGLVLWEMLVAERPIDGDNEAEILTKALDPNIPRPSSRLSGVPPAVDDVVMRAIAIEPEQRFGTAEEMAVALEAAVGGAGAGVASREEVGAWVGVMAGERLAERARVIAGMLEVEGKRAGGASVNANANANANASANANANANASGRLTGVVVAAAACVVVVVGWFFVVRGDAAAGDVATASSGVASGAIAAEDAAPITTAAVDSVQTAPTASAAPIISASAAPPASGSAAAAGSGPRPRVGNRPATAKCDPPWLIDSRGIRRYNPDCLK